MPPGAVQHVQLALPDGQPRNTEDRRIGVNGGSTETHLATEAMRQRDGAQHERGLNHLEEAGHQPLAPINDVLDLSTAESGELRMTQQSVVLVSFVDSTLLLSAAAALARGIALQCGPVTGVVRAARAAGFVDYWTQPTHFGPFLRDLGALLGRSL